MAFIPAERSACAYLRYTWEDQSVEFGICFQWNTEPGLAEYVTMGDAIVPIWANRLQPLTSTNVTFREIYFLPRFDETAPTLLYTAGLPLNGTVIEAAVANQVAACASHRTAGRGRSARGRSYIPGLAVTIITSGRVIPSGQAAMEAFFADIRNSAATQSAQQVVLSYYKDKAPRTTALVQPVTSTTFTSDAAATQRRRRIGVGI